MLKMERNIMIFGLSNMLFSHRHRASFPGPASRLNDIKPLSLEVVTRRVTTSN